MHIPSIRIIAILCLERCRALFSDNLYLKLQFKLRMGYFPDFSNPTTFSEKLQWLKIHYHNPLYTKLVDKYEVKEYVSKIIGDEYIIKTIGIWNNIDEIDWTTLPSKFVLKTTHGGGGAGVILCKDIDRFDKNRAINSLRKALKQDIYNSYLEWPYKNVQKRIMAEQYMVQSNGLPLIDYKFFCFNGEPKFLYVRYNSDNPNGSIVNFIYPNWTAAPFLRKNDTSSIELPKKPVSYAKMLQLASRLSSGMPFARIDLYDIDGKIYFSEITFFPASGLLPFNSIEWDKQIGDMLQLPTK